MNRFVYHRNCNDGYACRIIAQMAIKAEFYEIHPGEEFKDFEPGDTVFLADICCSNILQIADVCQVILLDHHETTLNNLQTHRNIDSSHCTRDLSGAGICWDYFFPDEDMPFWAQYVQDRDLWKWELDKSKEINTYIGNLQDHDVSELELDIQFGVAQEKGSLLLEYMNQQVAKARKKLELFHLRKDQAFPGSEFLTVEVVNSCLFQSEIGNNTFADLVIVWYAHERFHHSVRSNNELAGKFCEHRGGGGHLNAGGYITSLPKSVLLEKETWHAKD